MGQDISNHDVFIGREQFLKLAADETELLSHLFQEDLLENRNDHYGLELEGCLVDKNMLPAMCNEEFLAKANDNSIVPELGKFNFEFNSPCYQRNPHTFSEMLQDLEQFMKYSYQIGDLLGVTPIWVGALPTLKECHLTREAITERNRYFKLDKKLMELQNGNELEIKINRIDEIILKRQNILTEAVATSVQIHTQVLPQDATRAYNASLALSAPCLAIMANSPFLFGQKLWDETRISLFEQTIQIPEQGKQNYSPVSLGQNYLNESIFELFIENIEHHIPVLPIKFNDDKSKLRHLKFLNGQVWRWVRPIIGVDYGEQSHIRLEQRCFPAGPSAIDTIANTAFYIGLLEFYTHSDQAIEDILPFDEARKNFYNCAKYGVKAQVTWGGKQLNVQKLLHDVLLDQSRQGLQKLNFSQNDIDFFINTIMKQRIRTGWTGAAWQKSFIDTCEHSFSKMTSAYIENQRSLRPVSDWTLSQL